MADPTIDLMLALRDEAVARGWTVTADQGARIELYRSDVFVGIDNQGHGSLNWTVFPRVDVDASEHDPLNGYTGPPAPMAAAVTIRPSENGGEATATEVVDQSGAWLPLDAPDDVQHELREVVVGSGTPAELIQLLIDYGDRALRERSPGE